MNHAQIMPMNRDDEQLSLPGFEAANDQWRQAYDQQIGADRRIANRSGVPIDPIYTPEQWSSERYMAELGFPGQAPYTRGIYPTMHRGKTWTQFVEMNLQRK